MPFKSWRFRQVRWHDKLLALQRKEQRLWSERGGCRGLVQAIISRLGESVDGETVDSILGLRKLFDAQQARMYEPLDHDGSEDD